MEKDLTLIITVYNKAPYSERCVKSISEQTYLDRTKIIVCDDKSTDNSVEILKQAANKYRVPMTLFLNEKNLGLIQNMLKIYKMIDTEFWTVLDSDDYYIHSERLSRAVDFLRSHPDHSMHGCNHYWESSNGSRRPAFPTNVQSFSVNRYDRMPFFQVSSATFRNFWSKDLFNKTKSMLVTERDHFAEADGFRNFVAIHYGKLYADNFFGSVYTLQDSGIWSTLPDLEKCLLGSDGNYRMFKMAREFFHNEDTARFCLNQSATSYLQLIESLRTMMKNFSMHEFKARKYTIETLNLDSDKIDSIIRYMSEREKDFLSLGIKIVSK